MPGSYNVAGSTVLVQCCIEYIYSVTLPLYKVKVYLIMPNQLALFAVRQFDYFIYQDQKLNIDGQNIHNTHCF